MTDVFYYKRNHDDKICFKIQRFFKNYNIPLKKKNLHASNNKQMESNFRSLFLFLFLASSSLACPLNQNSLPISLACIQNIQCATGPNGSELILMQNCNKSWYYGTSNSTVAALNKTDLSLLNTSQIAMSMKVNYYYALVNYNNSKLIYHPFQSPLATGYQLPIYGTFIDYQPLYINTTNFHAVIIESNKVIVLQFSNNSITVTNASYYLSYNLTKIKCLQNYLCVIGTKNGMVIIFDSTQNKVKNWYNTTHNESVTLIQSKLIDNTRNISKIYIADSSGLLVQYILQNNVLKLERKCTFFLENTIFQVSSHINSSYLIMTDTMGNVSQIDLSTGILLDNINLKDYVANKSNVSFSVLQNSQTSYYLYNTPNQAIYYAEVTPTNTANQIILYCYNMFYYNITMDRCAPCNSKCATCNPLTGACIDCYSGYFNSGGVCLSCYYDSQGLTQYFDECFSFYDQLIMEKQKAVLQFLANIMGYFAAALNICGLLFVFLKLINNWNIICFYFFVPINIPFFFENLLMTMFKSFNSSVLETIGIKFAPSLNLSHQTTHYKFELTDISTDFMALNGQSIILFCYSVLLIMTLYRYCNHLLSKLSVSFFQQNVSISILEQFVASFTASMLPFFYIIYNSNSKGTLHKINHAMHFLLIGLSMILSSFFLILDYSYRKVKNSKICNQDQLAVAQAINKGFNKRIRAWRGDECKQRFLFAVLSFSTALLSCFPNPRVFFLFVGSVHILSLINAIASKRRSINAIIQKIQFVCFHGCFMSLYYIQNEAINMNISMAAILLIIVIAVHQMITSIVAKVYFVYMVIRLQFEKSTKINQFFQKNNQAQTKARRIRPISIKRIHAKKPNQKKTQSNKMNKVIKYKFRSFQAILHHQTQNVLQTSDNNIRSRMNCLRLKRQNQKINPKKPQEIITNIRQVHLKPIKQLGKQFQNDHP